MDSAKDMVRAGHAWAALVFNKNFSDSLRERIDGGRDVENYIIESGAVQIFQDISSTFNKLLKCIANFAKIL